MWFQKYPATCKLSLCKDEIFSFVHIDVCHCKLPLKKETNCLVFQHHDLSLKGELTRKIGCSCSIRNIIIISKQS